MISISAHYTNEQDEVNSVVIGTEQEGANFQCVNTNERNEVKLIATLKKCILLDICQNGECQSGNSYFIGTDLSRRIQRTFMSRIYR